MVFLYERKNDVIKLPIAWKARRVDSRVVLTLHRRLSPLLALETAYRKRSAFLLKRALAVSLSVMSHHSVDALSERPLEGTKFCCTSILPEHRIELATWVEDMGAEHTLDLTSDVTHLLVGDSDSEKYRYVAREREDVKVLLPSFVATLRELWMNHQPINFNMLEAEHKYPTFYGLKVSITGFENQGFRDMLADSIVNHGAIYSGDLTKEVTHLIANKPEGKKYQYASGWGLKIVSIKWYKDSLDRGMQLDESKYHPTQPAEEQGVDAWHRTPVSASQLGKRERTEPVEEKRSRKIRRTASAKFGNQHNDIWSNIVGQRPSDVSRPPTRQVQSSETLQDARESNTEPMIRQMPVPAPDEQNAPTGAVASKPPVKKGMFNNQHFAFKGFDERKSSILRQYLAGHAGEVHSASELFDHVKDWSGASFLIIPHDTAGQHLTRLRTLCSNNITIVTELWLENCISIKSVCSPQDYPLGQPIVPINLPAVANLIVNASGFPQIQVSHIAKVVKQLGAKYEETFTAHTSVLICNSRSTNKQKTEYAQRWKVPVVSEQWLLKMIDSQRIPSFEPYLSIRPVQRDVELVNKFTPVQVQKESAETSRTDAARSVVPIEQAQSLSDGFEQATTNQIVQQAEAFIQPVTGKNRQEYAKSRVGPLQEVSGNVQVQKPAAKAKKKKLFQQMDGPTSDNSAVLDENLHGLDPVPDAPEESRGNAEIVAAPNPDDMDNTELQDRDYQAKLVAHFWEVKAAAEARAASEAASGTSKRGKPKRLLGRALSNLSNASKRSNDNNELNGRERQPLSRASSINSANTDGLGMPLSMMSRVPSDLQNKPNEQYRDKGARALLSDQDPEDAIVPALDAALIALGTSQVPRPASPTASQMPVKLTYAESEEAAALKAHLAEKRRNRAKLGQKKGDPEPELSREESEEMRQRMWREREAEKNIFGPLQDDEAVVGVGRRTRGREKALNKLLGEVDDLMDL